MYVCIHHDGINLMCNDRQYSQFTIVGACLNEHHTHHSAMFGEFLSIGSLESLSIAV